MDSKKVAVILAGGRSSRFGSDKCFYQYEGKTFLERAIQTAHGAGFEVCLSGPRKKLATFGLTVFEDVVESSGGPFQALRGIFQNSMLERVLLMSCDMPLVTSSWLNFLWNFAMEDDSVALILNKKVQPFPAVYSKKQVMFFKSSVGVGLKDILLSRCTRLMNEDFFRNSGFQQSMFLNINEPDDIHFLIKKKVI